MLPLRADQHTGVKVIRGFSWAHHYVQDFDGVWWEEIVGPLGFERWKRLKARRNLLLTSASGSGSIKPSSEETT
jgi:hypothetical protein